jgi:predicted pyridoxine 5'-phosphate oxidase superfamily flavin-nucleotide-binding protein
MERPMYHDHSRALQDRFDSRRIADRLAEKLLRAEFSDEDRAFIARQSFFFLATADAQGRPDCSYKGGAPGFVQVVAPDMLAFPSYDGNGMFKSLGNIAANPAVGILFIDFQATKRLRVNGRAVLHLEDPLKSGYPGAQAIVRVRAEHIFPNCPRYIPRMELVEASPYVPAPGCAAPVPAWKANPAFRDHLPQTGDKAG